jgi:hypothetical protein
MLQREAGGWWRKVRSVKHFLLVFDRSESRLLSTKPFTDANKALTERFKAERLHRGNPDIEVVVLTAESADDLRVTHSRYFQTLRELASPAKKRVARKATSTAK